MAIRRNAFSIWRSAANHHVREGRLRCQWRSRMPFLRVFLARFALDAVFSRITGGLPSGTHSSAFIVITCASSTPVMSVLLVIIGMSFFTMRYQLRVVRWVFLGLLAVLHFTMNQPVWHLLARADIVGGSTGWHRYRIMDATINNFSEWWLIGESDPMSWGIWQMRDITNQYILEALRGGLLTLSYSLRVLPRFAWSAGAPTLEDKSPQHFLVFCVGVSLFVLWEHIWCFLFRQIIMLWYLNLAIIGSLPR